MVSRLYCDFCDSLSLTKGHRLYYINRFDKMGQCCTNEQNAALNNPDTMDEKMVDVSDIKSTNHTMSMLERKTLKKISTLEIEIKDINSKIK